MTLQLAARTTPLARTARSTDLFHPIFRLGELFELTTNRLESPDTPAATLIDAYLAVASICQVLADHVHRDHGDLRRIRKYARRLRQPVGGIAGATLGAAAAGLRAAANLRQVDVVRRLEAMEGFAQQIADALWRLDGGSIAELRREWMRLAVIDGLPLRTIAIPPRSFFTFDQRPEDCVELAIRFAERRPDRDRPVVVVGVRTSGCFLAPIVAAALRRTGYSDVGWTSWRPGQPRTGRDRDVISRAAGAKAELLIVDDPPTSGGSLARTASEIASLGVDRSAITLLLPLFEDDQRWQHRLAGWQQVRLGWQDWAIQSHLREQAVGDAISKLTAWNIRDIVRVDGDPGTAPGSRRHIRARFRVRVEMPDGRIAPHEILANGVGLGMFGDAAAAVANRLKDLVPTVYGVCDGVMYREWIPEQMSLDPANPTRQNVLAEAIANYATRRADALRVTEDFSAELSGHDAVWEQAGRWLGIGYGRLALPLRPLLHAASRTLTRTKDASVVDGSMGRGQWFEADGRVVKADFAEGTYVYQLPMSYDAAYDVAAAAAELVPNGDFGRLLRAEFEARRGTAVSDARWFLYEMISRLDRRDSILRSLDQTEASCARLAELLTEGERGAASLHRAFIAQQYLSDVETPTHGDLVAIDVDGVLEGGPWWYAAPSASSLSALRALHRHGYRPVLATGRSIGEAAERCRDYRLAGAVAEYGCAIHDAARGESRPLLGPDEVEDMRSLRFALARLDGVELDPAFRHAIRAFAVIDGRRIAIPMTKALSAVAECGLTERVRIEQGWAQTDFVPVEVDKRTGLQALLKDLGAHGDPSLALAVGDSTPDRAMFRLARIKAVPANAERGIERGSDAIRCRGAYGAGLAEAVAMLIGHQPGRCPDCAASPTLDPDTRLLVTLLDGADARGLRKLSHAARAWALLRQS